MSDDPLDLAGQLAEEMRRVSDLLKGAVATLRAEGWHEDDARRIVVHVFTLTGGKL
jgi:hypothetical protein